MRREDREVFERWERALERIADALAQHKAGTQPADEALAFIDEVLRRLNEEGRH